MFKQFTESLQIHHIFKLNYLQIMRMKNNVVIMSQKEVNLYHKFRKNMKLNLFVSYFCIFLFICSAILVSFLYYGDKNVVGKYSPLGDFIIIKSSSTYQMHITAFHEIGHHVYYTNLTIAEIEQWRQLFKQSSSKDFFTQYAKTNPSEDFAETYMVLTHSDYVYCNVQDSSIGNIGKVLNEKIKFMCDIVHRIE